MLKLLVVGVLLSFTAQPAELPIEYQLVQAPVIQYQYRVVNLPALEKRADYLLKERSKLTAAERRAVLRPKGALDVARCVEILVTFGLKELHSSIEIDPTVGLIHTDTP